MLDDLEWKSLKLRRSEARLAMLYKIDNDLVAIDKSERMIGKHIRFTRTLHDRSYTEFHTPELITGNSHYSLIIFLAGAFSDNTTFISGLFNDNLDISPSVSHFLFRDFNNLLLGMAR